MLGRTANDLFWLSRYVERAENMARLIEVGYRIALLPRDGEGYHEEWRSTLASAGCAQGYFAKHEALSTRDVINYLLFDCANASSVKSCLSAARHNGRAQRTSLTRDMWESAEQRLARVRQHQAQGRHRRRAAAHPRLDQVALRALSRRAAQHHPAQRHLSSSASSAPSSSAPTTPRASST